MVLQDISIDDLREELPDHQPRYPFGTLSELIVLFSKNNCREPLIKSLKSLEAVKTVLGTFYFISCRIYIGDGPVKL